MLIMTPCNMSQSTAAGVLLDHGFRAELHISRAVPPAHLCLHVVDIGRQSLAYRFHALAILQYYGRRLNIYSMHMHDHSHHEAFRTEGGSFRSSSRSS